MEKFSIVAALQLELDNSINTVVGSIRDRLKGAANIEVSTKGLATKIKDIKTQISQHKLTIPLEIRGRSTQDTALRLSNKVKSIISNVRSSIPEIFIDLKINSSSEENARKQLKYLSNSLTGSSSKNPILLDLKINHLSEESVNSQVKKLRKSLSETTNMIGGKIPDKTIGVSLDVQDNESAVVSRVKSYVDRINSKIAGSVVTIKSQVDDTTERKLANLAHTLSKIQSKNINVNLRTRDKDVTNLEGMALGVDKLGISINAVNPNLGNFTNTITFLSTALSKIGRLSGKDFSFGFSVKDLSALDRVEKGLNNVYLGFEKAYQSAVNFRSVLQSLVSIGQSFNSISANFNQNSKLPQNIAQQTSQAAIAQNDLSSAVDQSSNAMFELGKQSAITFKRFGAYTLVTAGFFRLSFAIRNAITEFIDFEQQLNKIRQVTLQSYESTQILGNEISNLAVKYGVSSKAISEVALTLAQAGFTTNQVTEALEALAKSDLSPTFESLEDTVEASIAAIAQFKYETNDLEEILSKINSVSAAFAVESSDLTTAIQKAGGSFVAAGGSLEELLALFTSVRATTRESADTIATGFRTIFTRLQRLRTGNFLSEFGVDIRKTAEETDNLSESINGIKFDGKGFNELKQGDFIGPYQAIKRLSEAMSNIPSGGLDSRFAQIAEELGGFRQINKVLPLLSEFSVAQDAYNVAMSRTDSLTKDALIAQETYANSLQKLREEFLLLVREFAENKDIKELINSMITLARVTIQAASAFKSLVLPVGGILTIASAPALRNISAGFQSLFVKKNAGGLIPGNGIKDDVPALLTRGEFVLRKEAVNKIGVDKLQYLNAAKFNSGGLVGGKGLALAGLGIAGIGLQSGLFKTLSETDSAFKDIAVGLVSFAASIKVLNLAIPSLTEIIKERGRKNSFVGPQRTQLDEFSSQIIASRGPTLTMDQSLIDNFNRSKNIDSQGIKGSNKKSQGQQISTLVTQLVQNNQGLSGDPNVLRAIRSIDPKFLAGGLPRINIKDFKSQYLGTFRSADNSININSGKIGDAASFDRVFLHEFGHFFDKSSGNASSANDFKGLISRLQKNTKFKDVIKGLDPSDSNSTNERILINALLGGGASDALNVKGHSKGYFRGDQGRIGREVFASAFAINQQNPEFLRKSFPELAAYFDSIPQTSGVSPINKNLSRRQQILERLDRQRPNLNAANQLGAAEGAIELQRRQDDTLRITRDLQQREFNKPSKRVLRFLSSEENINKIAGGVGIAGVGTSLLGTVLESESRRRIEAGNGNIGLARTGGALSSAGQGALTGAAIGSFFGPVGTAVGGVLGGMTGAVLGFVRGGKEFESAVLRMDISKISNDFQKVFSSIEKGETSFSLQRGKIVSNIESFQRTLQSTGDEDARQDIKASLDNNSLNIFNFAKSLAESSSTIDSFNQKMSDGTQRFVAGILGMPFEEFQEMIKKSIDSGNFKANTDRVLAAASLDFEKQVRSILRFNSAFSQNFESSRLSNSDSFASGGLGGNEVKSKISELIGSSANLSDVSGVTERIRNFGEQFGEYGRFLSKFTSDAALVENVLPDILLRIKSQDPLGETDVQGRLVSSLKQVGVGQNFINLIEARFTDLVGEDFKDSNFFINLEKDLGKSVDELMEGAKPAIEAFANATQKSAEYLNEYSQNLQKIVSFDREIRQNQSTGFGLQAELINSRASFNRLPPDFNALMALSERNQNLFTGGRTAFQLGRSILSSQSNIQSLDSQINATEDNNVRQQLIEARNKEIIALAKAKEGLEFLATNTEKVGILQSKLTQLQQQRLKVEDFENSFIFGTNQDKREQRRIIDATKQAVDSGDINSVPQRFRSSILSFLQQFEDQTVPGLNIKGRDAIDKIRKDAGFGPSTPSKDENLIQKQIESLIQNQGDANKAIGDVLTLNNKNFIESLRTSFNDFLTRLNTTVNQGFVRDITNQINSAETEKKGLEAQSQQLADVNSKFGTSALTNASIIKKNFDDINNIGNAPDILNNLSKNRLISNTGFSGNRRLSKNEVNSIFGKDLSLLPKNVQNEFIKRFNSSDIGLDSSSQTFSATKVRNVVRNISSELGLELSGKLSEQKIIRNDLISNVGGQDNFDKILKDVTSNSSTLLKLADEFPRDTTVKDLNSSIKTLNDKISNLRSSLPQIPQFNSGGLVGGSGNRDSVTARLTPGEFVLRKRAVDKYGLDFISHLNSGGLVRSNEEIHKAVKKRIPSSIIDDLIKYGVSVKTGNSLLDIDPELRFKKPRGHSSSIDFNSIKGLYRNSTKEVFLRNDSGIDVLGHELGHAFDYYKNSFSQSKEYLSAYMRDVSEMSGETKKRFKYFLQEGPAGRKESFAAIFDSVSRNNSTSRKYFPRSTGLVEGLVKSHEIQHFQSLYNHIRKLRNVENPDFKGLVDIIRNVRDKISTSIVKDEPFIKDFSNKLNIAESIYVKKFNSGGFVGGVGNTDSVNARLTPGEFVMKKSAVQKYGLDFMKRVNNGGVQKFANGGSVQNNNISINPESLAKFNFAVNQLAIQIENMKSAFAVIPSQIEMVGKHTLDINLNGAMVLQNIMPEVKDLILSEVKRGINNLIKKKFPQVGIYE